MHILISQKKKLGLLIALSITGSAVISSLVTQSLLHRGIFGDKSLWQWIILPESIFFIGSLTAVISYSYLRVNGRISELVDEALESLSSGVIYFEPKGDLIRFNPAAAIMIPELSGSPISQDNIGSYKKFLSYIYDHSLDIQDQSGLKLDIPKLGLSRLLFREVVELANHRIILAQFYQRSSKDIIVVLTDISMMKRHIEELASLTEENRIMIKAIEAGGSGMMIAQASDPAVPIIFANDIFAHIVQDSSDDVLNRPFIETFESRFGDQIDLIKAALQTARRVGRSDSVWLKLRKDKRLVIWYSFYILFFVDNNHREFFVCFLLDQTQARLSQAKVFQAQKLEAVAQLAGGVAHDFNNILSVIEGFSKIIQRSLSKGVDVVPLFENIDRSVQKGTQITSRLLTFGQRRVTQKIIFDVCSHIRDLETFLTPITGSTVNLILSSQDRSGFIEASPDAITQIVVSLVNNAKQSMPDGGDLILSIADASRSQILASQKVVDPTQNYICLQIIDSGMGMDQETLARIYEPFFTTKDPAKNSGLGMSLVYGLVKEMESFIDIKSTPDVGTSVSILIPAKSAPEKGLLTKEEHKHVMGDLSGKTILLVEDSAEVLEMGSQLLTELGLKVLKAENAEEALALQSLYDGKIDFLLADVTMPEMDGVELSDRFSQERPETKSILISAYPALATGEDPLSQKRIILAKPFAYQELEKVLLELSVSNKSALKESHHWSDHEKV